MKTKIKIITLLCALVFISTACAITSTKREVSICGCIKEPFVFWLWHSQTPPPNPQRVEKLKFVTPITFITSDNRTLTGYKYNAHDKSGNKVAPKGYVLVTLGNAMTADLVIGSMGIIAASGYDVYVYDYRGYGNSEGKSRINAILLDYKEIATSLNARYPIRIFYGISFGVVVITNLIGSGINYNAAILDSGPSRLSTFGCPKSIDPVVNIPHDASKILVITGEQDVVLRENMTGELSHVAETHGATIIRDAHFAHPFMDTPEDHLRRMEMIRKFIVTKITH
jgi:alpha/beta superfamily hydrolase